MYSGCGWFLVREITGHDFSPILWAFTPLSVQKPLKWKLFNHQFVQFYPESLEAYPDSNGAGAGSQVVLPQTLGYRLEGNLKILTLLPPLPKS